MQKLLVTWKRVTVLYQKKKYCNRLKYRIFQTIRYTPQPQIWEENEGASYNPNVAYLACWGGGEVAVVQGGVFPYFPPLKPRYVLWSGAPDSLKNTVSIYCD